METVQLLNRVVFFLGALSLGLFFMPILTRGRGILALHSVGSIFLVLAWLMAFITASFDWDMLHFSWVPDGDDGLRVFSGIVLCVSISLYWISGSIESTFNAIRELRSSLFPLHRR